jgi:hypothetical protein
LPNEDYAGLIDDIAIYSRALSAAEVAILGSEAAPDFTVTAPITSPPESIDAGGSPDAAEITD